MQKKSISTFLILLGTLTHLSLTHTLADELNPTPKQLELIFGIEEELRPSLNKIIYIASPFVTPIINHTIANALKLDPVIYYFSDLPATLMGVTIGDIQFESSLIKKQKKFVSIILEECKREGRYLCDQDNSGKIFFKEKNTAKEIGHLNVKLDPKVIEVTANPFTIKELDGSFGDILENSLFKASRKAGLHSTTFGGEGHVHLDFNALFGGEKGGQINYEFFRNYIVDWANHNELYYGAFHYDPKNIGAEPLLNTVQKRSKFNNWLNEYDLHLKNGTMNKSTFLKLKHDLAICGFERGSAINVISRVANPESPLSTIEIRCLRTNKKLPDLARKLKILQARAQYIYEQKGLITYHNAAAIQNAQEGVNRFGVYLQEAGLEWNEYKKVLPITWQLRKPKKVPTEELFSPGAMEPNQCFKFLTRTLIHIIGQ